MPRDIFRLKERWNLAVKFAEIAANLKPNDDLLFVDHAAYQWRSRDEWSISAYWSGDFALSARLCRELLADAGVAGTRAAARAEESGIRRGETMIDYGDGIYGIDTGFFRPNFDAAYLVVENGRAAFIDVGTNYAVPRLLDALAERNLDVAMSITSSSPTSISITPAARAR